jgi:7,8-dihydropterin-6-yl-methyl-4-(beta-D-ribofuranosyl)aminobenzene 5'-phosphate synthase
MKSYLIRLLLVLAGVALLLAALYFVRLNQARQIVTQARAATPATLTNIGSTRSLSILPLVEAAADESQGLQGEFGVSYLVRTDDAVILLDLGENEKRADPSPLENNMRLLKVDPQSIGAIVISHNHPDHVGGAHWWLKHTFSFGKQQISLSGIPVYLPTALSYPGVQPVVSDAPVKIAEGVATTGIMPFEEVQPLDWVNPLNHEQNLVINVAGQGLVVITGCGHPGLETMLQRAEAVFGLPVVGVVGGLHYQNAGAATLQPHIDFLAARNPRLVALSPHDSSAAVLQAFQQAFPDAYQKVEVGVEIRFP